ncbi:Glycosyl hydrolases family 43 [Streptomyces sp. OV198]|uniref:family 43 glycosylhydrolase n=1 Tax=Streptomyces sp. OV198 TaxID=1882787 RepID=UPI000BCEFB82|nr:family 43 glycosylhydrolase [Streptomyces sp. OV198]SOE53038.1 Glycosyl hydrolases family 43 [Streptomyces sp. OV198]
MGAEPEPRRRLVPPRPQQCVDARGFDASLFHDGADSRLLNLVHDWRRPWYHLLTADGGTGYDHQVTVARSRTLTGPYERDPAGPLITARHHPDLPLQKAGHGSLVDTPGGLSYLAYLVARPHTRHGPCGLGRETALAPVTWTPDGWPRTPSGLPALEIPAPDPLTDGTDPRPDDHDGHDDLGDPADADGFDGSALRFRYDTGPGRRPLGPTLDATVFSGEHAEELEGDRIRVLGFTGAFVGLWAWDLTGGGPPADFDVATYRM